MKKDSYTVLILILVLMAISLPIITAINLLAVDEAKLATVRYNSDLGLYLSTSCAEHALGLIRASNNPDNFTTPETRISITFPGNIIYYCWYSVEGRTPNKIVRSRSDLVNFPRRIEIKIIKIDPNSRPKNKITIGYWLEK